MGRVKDWWMNELDRVVRSYQTDLIKGIRKEEAWEKALVELTKLTTKEYAEECLSAATPSTS